MSVLDTWITPSILAEELGVSTVTLTTWRRTGAGPQFRKVGAFVWYSRAAVAAWLERDQVQNSAQAKRATIPARDQDAASTTTPAEAQASRPAGPHALPAPASAGAIEKGSAA